MDFSTDTFQSLDFKPKLDKKSKQNSVDVFVEDNESFTYVFPSTCFPKNNLENIPKSVALEVRRIRRICNSDEKFEKHSAEYQNYLIARDYKPAKTKKKTKPFSDIEKLTREEVRKPKLLKSTFSTSCNLITRYNPLLPNLKTNILNYKPLTYFIH